MAESTAITFLKKTPIHCVVKVSGPAGNKTISLATDMLFGIHEVATNPKVDIMGIHWGTAGIATADAFTVVRNSITVYTALGHWGEIYSGYTDSQENGSDIVVTLAQPGWVILELVKIAGYGNTQHRNNDQDG
jgi:hypothetical protein